MSDTDSLNESEPSPRQVENVARLARLGITPEEVARYRDQLRDILNLFEALNRVDTSKVPATAHPLEERNVMRDDWVEPSLSAEEALRNAPNREGPYFKVNRIIE